VAPFGVDTRSATVPCRTAITTLAASKYSMDSTHRLKRWPLAHMSYSTVVFSTLLLLSTGIASGSTMEV
jgi:hypothetical protein